MKTLLFAALLTLAAGPAFANSVKAGDLTIESAWARATPKGASVGAAYVTIKNGGATADHLTGVTADFARVELHEMKMANGVMQMREVTGGLDIPAHQTVTLAPNGYHLMLLGLKHPLAKGDVVKATLTFEHAGPVAVDMPVLGVGSPGPAGGAAMNGMKM